MPSHLDPAHTLTKSVLRPELEAQGVYVEGSALSWSLTGTDTTCTPSIIVIFSFAGACLLAYLAYGPYSPKCLEWAFCKLETSSVFSEVR